MAWFWALVGALAGLVVLLAWFSDRSAGRRGLRASSGDIARNLREAKRQRRQRLMVLGRTWVPTDDREPRRDHGPASRPTNRSFRG